MPNPDVLAVCSQIAAMLLLTFFTGTCFGVGLGSRWEAYGQAQEAKRRAALVPADAAELWQGRRSSGVQP